ncbi:hypothetical protein SUGI_0549910 [Cryptomeria japonica]|nr:hypothetical protein SUGI_0549910 [Cryptomeria japonica]
MDADFTEGPSPAIARWSSTVSQRFQHYLDKSTPHYTGRWLALLLLAAIYVADPEMEGPALPTKGSDEFKPFIRRLPEFKFWYSITKAFVIAFAMTFSSIFDVPVFWPILLFYWVVLFVLTMKRQILHMMKYKYVPFSVGKQRYAGKKPTAEKPEPQESEEDAILPQKSDLQSV